MTPSISFLVTILQLQTIIAVLLLENCVGAVEAVRAFQLDRAKL